MTRAELFAELKAVLNDSDQDGMWSDRALLNYLAEGQDIFCEETGYFQDKTNYTITLVADQADYALSDRIIKLEKVWDGTRQLKKLVSGGWPTTVVSSTPAYWTTGREAGKVSLYPTPTADNAGDTYALDVWRYSRNYLADTGASPEIPARFHWACVEWAAYKALSNDDMEIYDPKAAARHKQNFFEYVANGRIALDRIMGNELYVEPNQTYVV